MSKTWAAALLALPLAAGLTGQAEADPGTLTMTGDATGSVTLPSASPTPFTDASFTLVATFHWSGDLISGPVGSYPAVLSFVIGGGGPYVSVPGAADAVLYQDHSLAGYDGVEIDTVPHNITEAFNTETWDPSTQTLTLSDPAFSSADPPFNIQLADGGTLEIDSFVDLGPTASIFAPEPGTLGLLGFGLAAIGLLRRQRKV